MAAVYLDSSAIVKLVVREQESLALRRFLRRRRPWVSSALARTEVLRAVRHVGPAGVDAAEQVFARCELVRVNDTVLTAAGLLDPPALRSLDAIHFATAARLAEDLGWFVVYDSRLIDAAGAVGWKVASPA